MLRSCFSLYPLFALLCLASTLGFASEYYVALDGDDSNPGTIDLPFGTVQHAADLMTAGDTCYLREGTYHQEIVAAGLNGTAEAPIVFAAYPGEKVTFDGTVPITGEWTQHEGDIYKTALNGDIWQLFVDGEMMVSARWPNAKWSDGTFWNRDGHWAQGGPSDSNGAQYSIPYDNVDLAGENRSFTGSIAILNVGNWKTFARYVNDHEPGSDNFTYDPISSGYKARWELHRFFLECSLELLDVETEWFYEPGSGELYLWSPGGESPAGLDIRGKTQTYAFYLNNSRHVRIQGLDFFATTFYFDTCTNMTVEDCSFMYPSYSRRMLGEIGDVEVTSVEQPEVSSESGCSVRNCVFAYTDGPGIYMRGMDNTIENCFFHDIDYSVVNYKNNGFSIHTLNAPGITFRRNTMHTTGASEGFRGGNYQDGHSNLVEYNHLYNCGLLQSDGGNVQMGANSGHLAVVRYNWIHDTTKYCIRFDGKFELDRYSTDGLIHHNLCWATTNVAFRIKGDGHYTYNNIGFDSTFPDIVIRGVGGGMKNAITRNNAAGVICGEKVDPNEPIPGTHSNNWTGDVRTQLRDPDALDFRPQSETGVIDAGLVIAGITDGFAGSAPDIGAYEYGADHYWIPGRQLDGACSPVPPDNTTGFKSDADLMWLEGRNALSHNVFFGQISGVLDFQANQTSNIFTPGTLQNGTLYYWRVDTVAADYLAVGQEWSLGESTASDNGENDAPQFDDGIVSAFDVVANKVVEFPVSQHVYDPDAGDILVFSKVSGPDWMAVTKNGTISAHPALDALGIHEFVIEVTDSEGASATTVLDVTVTADSEADFDGDGLVDSEEVDLGTNPENPDSDEDGTSDGLEIHLGHDPLDSGDTPVAGTGDVNFDGVVDAVDIQLVINSALGKDILPFEADLDASGTVDATDVQLVINTALGLA